MSVQKSLPKSKNVSVNGNNYEVKKQGLISWAEVALKFDNFLGVIFDEFDNMNEKNWIERFPKFIANNIPVVINILEVATPLSHDELENEVGIDEAIDLAIAVIEVNNLMGVSEKAKNLIALVSPKK